MRDRRIVPYNLRLKETSRTLRRDATPAELVIEIDGDSHFTETGRQRDAERTAMLERFNLDVLRFTNAEVMEDFEGVCLRVRQTIAEKA